MDWKIIQANLLRAADTRAEWLSEVRHECAFRLFHGFTEGFPPLTVDILARTAVLHDHTPAGETPLDWAALADILLETFPFLDTVVGKRRNSPLAEERVGRLLRGNTPARRIVENLVRYAVNPLLNVDNSFYADTRELRRYLKEHSAGKRVLNTFAYTGSLGVAALAGGAAWVLQTDRSSHYLEMSCRSASLNGLTLTRKNLLAGDFFRVTAKLRKEAREFDTVILDPPYFTKTAAGTVDAAQNQHNLINKVRPLVADGGVLIVVCNALFLSGKEIMAELEALEKEGYLTLEEIIPVPKDAAGENPDYEAAHIANPAPFNHPTKIALLRVRKKA